MQADVTQRHSASGNIGGGDPLNVSVPEAARRLGVGPTKMWQLVHGGDVESIKIGARRVVPLDALDAYVKSLRDADATHPPAGPSTPPPPSGPKARNRSAV